MVNEEYLWSLSCPVRTYFYWTNSLGLNVVFSCLVVICSSFSDYKSSSISFFSSYFSYRRLIISLSISEGWGTCQEMWGYMLKAVLFDDCLCLEYCIILLFIFRWMPFFIKSYVFVVMFIFLISIWVPKNKVT